MARVLALLVAALLLGSNALVALLTSVPAQAASCPNGADTWNGPTGFFGTAADWSLGFVPTATDYACVTAGDPEVTDQYAVAGITMTGGSLTINGGSLELADTTFTSTINNLDLENGLLQADDGPSSETVDLTGTGTWSVGTMGAGVTAGTGLDSVVVITPGSILTVSGPTAGDAPKPDIGPGTSLDNDGTLDWNAGYFCVSGDGLTNESDGTFYADGSALVMFDCNSGTAPVTNDGTMNVSAAASGAPQIDNNFAQNGTLAVITVMNFDGNFSSSATSVFEPSLSAPPSGVINLYGTTEAVGGTIQPMTAEFVPTAGQQFVVITCDNTCTGSYPPTQDGYLVTNTGGEVILQAEPLVSLSAPSLDFGSVFVSGTPGTLSEVVTNAGSAPLSVSSDAVTSTASPDPFTITNDACAGQLFAPGSTCTIDLQFQPTLSGPATASLVITDDAQDSPQTVPLSGSGVTEPGIELAPNALSFPATPFGTTSSAMSLTVTSVGTAPLQVSSLALTGTDPGDFADSTDCITSSPIDPNGTCTIDVTFTPTAGGTRTASLEVFSNVAGSPTLVSLTGLGTVPGISLGPNPLDFGSSPVGTAVGPLNETVTNTGSAPLTISLVALSGTNSADFTLGPGCSGVDLAPGEMCTVQITFTPSAGGPRTATLSVPDNVPGSPQQVTLTGSGAQPGIATGPNPLDFGPVAVATAAGPLTETVTNTGTAPLSVGPVSMSGADPSDFALGADGCTSGPIAPAATCTIDVTFTPSATGARTATLSIVNNATANPVAVGVQGSGTAPGILLAPNPLDFPATPVGASSAPLTETVTNTGTSSLSVNSVAPTGADPGDFALGADSCASSQLAPGASCSVQVTFTPAAAGSRTAALVFTDTGPGSPQTVNLSGTGTAPAVTFSLNPIAFPATPVGTPATALTETLTNSGAAPLVVTSVTLGGTNAGDFSLASNGCNGATVAANGGTCSVMVGFTPAAAGARTASLIATDNAAGSPQTVAITGTGTVPGATFSPNPIAFPATPVGTPATPLTETLTNSGLAPLAVTAVTLAGTNAADFGLASNSCNGATVAAGSNCTVIVTFTPAAAGALTASLSVADNVAGSPQTLAISGTGTVPGATASPNPLAFPATTVGASNGPVVVTLSSSGAAPLVVGTVGISGADAAELSIASDTCSGATLAAGANCTVGISFTPAAVGARSATLSFADNAAGSPQTVSLTGTGSAVPLPAVSLTINPITFPATPVGSPAPPQAETLTNSGTSPLTLQSVTLSGPDQPDFLLASNSCNGATVPAGAGCGFVVEFIPGAGGARTAQLIITSNAPGGAQSVTLTGTGQLPAGPLTVGSLTRPPSPSPAAAPTPRPSPSPSPATVLALTLSRPAASPTPTRPAGTRPTTSPSPPPPSPGPSPVAAGLPSQAPPTQVKPSPQFIALSLLGLPYGPAGTGLNTLVNHYPAGCTTVYFFYDTTRIGSARVNASGQASAGGLSIPGNAKPGIHTITSSCQPSGTSVVLTAAFRVTAGLHRSAFLTSLNPPKNVAHSLKSISLSAAIAVLLLALLGFPSQVFNATLQEHYEEVRRWFHMKRPLSDVVKDVNQRVLFPAMLVVGGLLFALITPDFGFNLSTLALGLGLAIAVAVVTVGFAFPTYLYFLGKYKDRGKILVMPGTIIVGAFCVLLSRLAHFEPGYLYGLLAIFVFHHESSEETDGRLAAVSALLVLVLALLCWVFRIPLTGINEKSPSFLALVGESALSGAFVLGVESVIVGLLPMKFLDGSRIKRWSTLVWGLLFALGLFTAVQILLQPGSGYVGHTTAAGKLTVLSLYVAFGLFSFGFWAYFRYRKPRADEEELDTEGDYEVR